MTSKSVIIQSMDPPKYTQYDYINFLIATPRYYSYTEAARGQSPNDNPAAHDSLNHLPYRLNPDSQQLWQESKVHVNKDQGILVIGDSTLDKAYAQKWNWSPAIGQVNTNRWSQELTSSP